MLKDYSEGAGSAEIEAQKSANNIQGNLNKLSNQFTDTVGNIVNSDLMNTGVKGLTTALSGLNTVTDKLGTSGSIASVIGLLSTFNNSGESNLCKYARYYKTVA